MPEINHEGNVVLKPLTEVFKVSGREWGGLTPYPSWSVLIESAGLEILYRKTVGYYQGDYHVLVTDGSRFGYMDIAYGSCSGCDALQACENSLEDLTDLRDRAINGIHWELTKTQLLNWFSNRDWEVQPIFLSSSLSETAEAFNEMQKILHPNYKPEDSGA